MRGETSGRALARLRHARESQNHRTAPYTLHENTQVILIG